MEFQRVLGIYRSTINDSVEGWLFETDLLMFWVFNLLQIASGFAGDLCELGCHHGKTAILFGMIKRAEERLYCFDEFRGDNEAILRANIERFSPGTGDCLHSFRGNLNDLTAPPSDRIDRPLRLLHVDAQHDHVSVLKDLGNFTPLLAPHGVVAMDDYFDPEYPGVSSAVTLFCDRSGANGFRPLAVTPAKLYLCRANQVRAYQKALLECGAFNRMAWRDMFGGAVLVCFSRLPQPLDSLRRQFDAGGRS